ncbi:NAD(P)-dependent oxidoreductase [Mesonia sp. HuA40]|uniref:NAD-dependent epimerase/dehydratase family protein n=1 Tax=Mesonia sp. HuA40 TaxID=2602761 RepID=UPI0011C81C6B|nr:NAD(P)-dependent oxidoreductase [Mesonia sp. HuA40]TXK74044.1 NAD(P)-dependent oxidoreductase [Mesonia sp. HuA40]
MERKKVLVTGASGTVGYEVLKQLIKNENYEVFAFDLKTGESSKRLATLSNKVTTIYGNISVPEDLQKLPENLDAVIHLAAIIPPLADEQPELATSVNVKGTQLLIKQLEKTSPDVFLIYSSSISVYGDRLKTPFIKVEDPLTPSMGDEYAITKIKGESLIKESAIDYTIFRLTAIMGNHKMSKLMFHQSLDTSLEIATPRDTARAFVNAIKKQKVLSKKTYNLGGGKDCRISYRDFLKRSFHLYGLGEVDFPKGAFATKNFHCGFYADGDELENLVHFRRDTLDDYFEMEEKKLSKFKKLGATLFKRPIKFFLLKQSEPYKALKENNKSMQAQFFE